ncbi:DUF1845 family protein [Acidovorax sp. sic0104]|uniref:DUF1845 family protein n=1 Tax=Acidovorax sp. sic0104 TaxID=2854784 RepID=UPI001C48059C|nr:DUF1845 family protein [Acidovorax sp. sic0104]MBV7542144.1 DUF1845 family protein [Acidovorax sp. sic0104]
MKFDLHSFNAQKTFDRGFEQASESLFTLSVLVRALTSEAQAMEVEAIVNKELDDLASDIKAETERLKAIAETAGVDFKGISYSAPKKCEARITSPRAAQMVKAVKDFDALACVVDALWISRELTDSERSKVIYGVQKKILRLGGVFRTLATRAMASTQRQGDMHVQDPRVGTKLDPDVPAADGSSVDAPAPPTASAPTKPRKPRAEPSAQEPSVDLAAPPAEQADHQGAAEALPA